jgi:pilus assembly protein CpaF
MRRAPGGKRRLDEVGVLRRSEGGVCVVPVWRAGRWTAQKGLFTELVAAKGVVP